MDPRPDELTGKVALVIGAGSIKPDEMSNGRATAITYARAGAKVVAVDVSAQALAGTTDAITAEGYECLGLVGDASDETVVNEIVAAAIQRFGSVDILHNNIGILTFGSVLKTDVETWDRIMMLNVRSMFLATRTVLPHMIERKGGSIVNISALASARFLGAAVTYMTSKAAVNGFTQAVALENARHGIRCNAILPGFIDTPVGLSVYEGGDPVEAATRKAKRNAALPSGKAGTPWDIARAALFLASDAAAYINGVLLPVESGVMLLSPTAA
ncbi:MULTISPECIES: SDR family oxidoreductase [unclassified Beijerinckia]|uniref:SDR family NAD(P)-dependent oxidoreductase n=1 Tax=unclassified Beijerinckia TaxID=2638183 RepID=UPI000895ED03|nr:MULTISPECIES: SDR family oxidoreductase [unclassified Beijerinckia]MDH7797221.1 NAD(P)-dependent dehydrogenase (short-subunit alcohol dehydrogenase family) [Beijerinckia sp. GAS462]SEC76864.1 NAD(P)-dependent dehydrogenase, short-chain alcohol dehydrogenase family [Beijerinckia sp. 28-YEA-48]